MIHDIVFFLLGLSLVVMGGNFVTDGASSVARYFRLSPLLIGVTVVAFGSSMPDLVVCLSSTLKGHSELALGDVVGSNIIDILLVTGVVALIRPLSVDNVTRGFDMPMLALSCLAMFFCGDDMLLDGAPRNVIDRSDGLMLLSLFAIYMALSIYFNKIYSVAGISQGIGTDSGDDSPNNVNLRPAVFKVAAGLAALVVGGNWFVDGASGIAVKAGLSEGLVGLTIVSVGSAAPDLATSVIAILKGEPGIAIGNVLGACIFNVFFIMGVCSVISPLNVSTITPIDFGTLALGGVMVCIFSLIHKRIGRVAGGILATLYLAYLVKLVMDF